MKQMAGSCGATKAVKRRCASPTARERAPASALARDEMNVVGLLGGQVARQGGIARFCEKSPPAIAPLTSGDGARVNESMENSQWPENDSSLNGDVSMGDNVGSLIFMKPKPVAS